MTQTECYFDDDICPRCGAAMQLTHHILCQYSDGTPTKLSNKEVRKVLAVLEMSGAVVTNARTRALARDYKQWVSEGRPDVHLKAVKT